MPLPFVDDEAGYLSWLRDHPQGYVLNTDRSPRAAYLILHRATCRTISGRSDNWTHNYAKVCADTVSELEVWARAKTGGFLTHCGICAP
jgi:hypothetical protein